MERPILFSAPMVRAILEGRKSMTRRVLKPQPSNPPFSAKIDDKGLLWWELNSRDNWMTSGQKCPYGVPGDRLWVKETFQVFAEGPVPNVPDITRGEVLHGDLSILRHDGAPMRVSYKADGSPVPMWRPSIFMPRWASRITLEVVSVRCEHLTAITDGDVRREGFFQLPATRRWVVVPGSQYGFQCWRTARQGFFAVWNALNTQRGFAVEMDPWVWVVEFKRVKT